MWKSWKLAEDNAQYLPELRSQWKHQFPMNLWVQKQDCGSEVQQAPAAAPLSRTASADPARAPPYCSHQGETQHQGWRTQNYSSVNRLGTDRQHKDVFSSAHLNSTALNKRISVVLAPQTMCPIASSMLESNWLTLSLVEFNMVVNRAASWGENKSYELRCNFFCLVFLQPVLI